MSSYLIHIHSTKKKKRSRLSEIMAMLHGVIRLVRVIYRSQYTIWHGGSQIASMTIHTPPERGVMEYYSCCCHSGFEFPLLCYDLLLFHLIIYGLLFHFNVVYSTMCSLHHFCVLLSLSSVIVHCTIHVFQIS